MGQKALLVIDMLNDFLDPRGPLYCGDQSRLIIPDVIKLLKEHRQAGSVIVFVTDSHAPDDKEFNMFPAHCVAGTRGAEIIPEITLEPGDNRILKTTYSSLFKTELEDLLIKEGVSEVHLAGVCTSICIMEAASELRVRDYQVYVHEKAVADFDDEAHKFSLKRIKDVLGGQIVN